MNKILSLLCSLILLSACGSPPTDESLIKKFQEHKDLFEYMATAFQEENDIERLSAKTIYPEHSRENIQKIKHYRENMKKMNVSQIQKIVFTQPKNQGRISIYFTAYSRGLGISGESKSYLYTNTQPDLIVNNLDEYYQQRRATNQFISYFAYRPIADNWYLVHIVDD